MKTRILMLTLVLVLSLALAGLALADNGFAWPRWVLGSGATDAATGDVNLRATLGQPVVGVVSAGDVTLGQGFWRGGALPEGVHEIYLPLIAKNTW